MAVRWFKRSRGGWAKVDEAEWPQWVRLSDDNKYMRTCRSPSPIDTLVDSGMWVEVDKANLELDEGI